jgi:hypothetical protein
MTSTAVESVTCGECRHENEIERIYCHNCGARLERRHVAKAAPKEEETRKRVKKLFDPNRAKLRALFFRISKIALGSCLAAVLVVMATPPELPVPPKGLVQARAINFDVEQVLSRHQAVQLKYSETELNGYLSYFLKSKHKQLDEPMLEFKRVVVGLREGSCAVTMERALFGYSLFTTLDLAPQNSGGKAGLTTKGGSIGRLPIHPQIAQYMNYLFLDLWRVLDREKKLGQKLSGVDFHDKAIVLSTSS